MIPESPKALALDGTLVTWATFVIVKGLPAMITLVTLILVCIRALIAWREWKNG